VIRRFRASLRANPFRKTMNHFPKTTAVVTIHLLSAQRSCQIALDAEGGLASGNSWIAELREDHADEKP
jgi:hypothetical protein